ncbi:GTP cyclohydrolase FolE2 [Verrucomicrobia bacterium]|jgi:GTP cyclohydrolase IB|nr:GTP cyclohydrolase I FolE2 [Verrucomicrobiota bacterium]MDA7866356.1 GTP cyclohydrolase FolE2 [Verrucomicrobiota bacterium]
MPPAIEKRGPNETKSDSLQDLQSEPDHRAISINKVGIRHLQMPIAVHDRGKETLNTVGTFDLYVDLPADVKGTHMSRFVEILHAWSKPYSVESIESILRPIQDRLGSAAAYITLNFPFFLEKTAPVSKQPSLMNYQVKLSAQLIDDHTSLTLQVEIPVKTLCPCSKSISKYGAHNQRGLVIVQVRSTETIWIQEIIDIVEASGSSELYALLKRPDEKYVTESAYENPVFVEDLVRNVVSRLNSDDRISWFQVEAENHESIHNHNAYALISKNQGN